MQTTNPHSKFITKALKIIKNDVNLQKYINYYNITDDEIIDNLVDFINVKECLDNIKTTPYIIKISRDQNNDLCFTKTASVNKVSENISRNMNLLFSSISQCTIEADLKKVRRTSRSRNELIEYINILKTALLNHKEDNFKNIFIYGANKTGKTYIAHAIANEFSKSGISTTYLRTKDLFNFLTAKIKSNEGYSDIIYGLKSVRILIIDSLGLEKNST
ncbi:UNVERIFIED_CONTAM: ATP-binding protein [Campylobacter lari]